MALPAVQEFLKYISVFKKNSTVDFFKYINRINKRSKNCIFALKFDDFEGRYFENKPGTLSISFHFRMPRHQNTLTCKKIKKNLP